MLYDPVSQEFRESFWKNINVGDILMLKNDEFIPADLLILSTSDEKGAAYVETKNLDGETNLKIKAAHKEMHAMFKKKEALQKITG